MEFKIPFTFSPIEKLRTRSRFFSSRLRYKKKTKLGDYLKDADVKATREEYLGIVIRNFVISMVFLYFIFSLILMLFVVQNFMSFSILLAILFSVFVFFAQINYPRIYIMRKQKDIEKNLIPALEDMLVQLNSGIPLFDIMVNISSENYGELSLEFKKAVKRINAGEADTEVLNDIGKKNPSVFFRRTLWQISNGMNAGSDIAVIVKDSIHSLNEEQLIQIQSYGNKLNPLIVMYMLIAVIIPALSIAFLTIVSSLINLPGNMTTLLFIALFVFDVLVQVMFIGIVKSKKPSLL